jgi:peptide/nickel transport system permease protein
MSKYIIRRLLASIPVVFLVTLIAFSIMQLVPGDPAAVIAGSNATQEEIELVRQQLGLGQPFLTRLLAWYGDLLHGDLGQSILLQRSVASAIIERLPVTLSLTAYALVLTIIFGVAAGVTAAVNRGGWIDQLCMAGALLGVSLPNFWLGLILIFTFAVGFGWFPTGGYVPFSEDPVAWLSSLTLPAFTLAFLQMGLLARITRSSMLEVLQQEYVRTARAKGLPPWIVVGKHALRNVLIPVVTVIGIITSHMVSGSVVIETVYSLPGLGRLVIQGILRRDYPVIQGGLLVTAGAFVAINLLVDLLYSYLDPRVQLAQKD